VPPALRDPLLVAASFLVLFTFVAFGRWAGSHLPGVVVRRGLHVAVGLWTAFVTLLFRHVGWALVPPVAFLAINASGRTGRLVPALDRAGDSGSSRGLWTFPLGVALTYALFWSDDPTARARIVAGCLVLALSDPAAAWIGTRLGQRRLRPLRLHRTLEGSIAFFLVATLAVAAVAWQVSPGAHAIGIAVGCAAAGMVVEAMAPPGWDNAAIPLAVAAAYRALT